MQHYPPIKFITGFFYAFVSVSSLAMVMVGCDISDERFICTESGCWYCKGDNCFAKDASNDNDTGNSGYDAGKSRPDSARIDKDSAGDVGADGSVDGMLSDGGLSDSESDSFADVAMRCTPGSSQCVCGKDDSCSEGTSCLDGMCLDACEYSSQCKDLMVCLNGKCVVSCEATRPCPDGFTCGKLGTCEPDSSSALCDEQRGCLDTQVCVDGVCTAKCSSHEQCAAGQICDYITGGCMTDPQPERPCSANPDLCASSQVCSKGFCRYTCQNNESCRLIDARIPVCKDGVCMSKHEANPQCVRKQDCSPNKQCISNVCK